jgi:hypothetical protein
MNGKRLSTIVLGLCVAALFAVAFGYLAHDGFGYSRHQVRDVAIVSASLLGTLLAVDYLSKLRRAK